MLKLSSVEKRVARVRPAALAMCAVAAVSLAAASCSQGAANSSPPPPTAAALAAATTAPPTTAPATTAAPTTTLAPTSTTLKPILPLRVGDSGPLIAMMQAKLKALGYDPGELDGKYGPAVQGAVWAFQRVNGLTADGDIGPKTLAALDNPKAPVPMRPDGPPNRVEVSVSQKLLVLYKDNAPVLITHVSSGSRVPFCENGVCGDAVTPTGDFTANYKINGWETGPLGSMYNSVYFKPAYAIHGAQSVPDVGASHGCVRIPMHIAEYFPSKIDYGTAILIQE